MNARILILLPLCLVAPSCDKAKALVHKARESATASSPVPENPAPEKGPVDLRMLDSTTEHDEFIKTRGPLIVTNFHWKECQHSVAFCQVLDNIAAEYPGRIVIGRVDIEEQAELTRREGYDAFPRTVLYRDGKRVDEIDGFVVEGRVRELFEKHTKGIKARPVVKSAAEATGPAAPPIQPMTKDWRPPGIERR